MSAQSNNTIRGKMNDEDVKTLAKKYVDFNARFVKSELIAILGDSKDKSMIDFLTEIKKNTSDERIYKNLTDAIKKLNVN